MNNFLIVHTRICKDLVALRHHDRIEIDTSISVIVVSATTWEAHHNDLNLGINSYSHYMKQC